MEDKPSLFTFDSTQRRNKKIISLFFLLTQRRKYFHLYKPYFRNDKEIFDFLNYLLMRNYIHSPILTALRREWGGISFTFNYGKSLNNNIFFY